MNDCNKKCWMWDVLTSYEKENLDTIKYPINQSGSFKEVLLDCLKYFETYANCKYKCDTYVVKINSDGYVIKRLPLKEAIRTNKLNQL
jgi:hypothetical protein